MVGSALYSSSRSIAAANKAVATFMFTKESKVRMINGASPIVLVISSSWSLSKELGVVFFVFRLVRPLVFFGPLSFRDPTS